MEIVSRRLKAKYAANRYEQQYPNVSATEERKDRMPQKQILRCLRALGPDPHPDDVDAVLGNDTWTTLGRQKRCGECGGYFDERYVKLGAGPTNTFCRSCIDAASRRLRQDEDATTQLTKTLDANKEELKRLADRLDTLANQLGFGALHQELTMIANLMRNGWPLEHAIKLVQYCSDDLAAYKAKIWQHLLDRGNDRPLQLAEYMLGHESPSAAFRAQGD